MNMWLRLVFSVFLIMSSFTVHAAVPQTINYQGYLRNSAGQPVTDTISIVFSLYGVPSGGATLWTETQNVQVNEGVYSVVLGSVMPITLPFDSQYYLGITISGAPELAPRHPLTNMPYAFRAKQAENVDSSANISTQNQIVSTAPAGTAPFQIASNTVVENLNADMMDGRHSYEFLKTQGDSMLGWLQVMNNSEPAMGIRVGGTNLCYPTLGCQIYYGELYWDNVAESLNLKSYTGPLLLQNGTTGFVGIGTAAPQTKLHVAGTVKATAFQGDGSGLTNVTAVLAPGSSNYIQNGTSAQNADLNITGKGIFGAGNSPVPVGATLIGYSGVSNTTGVFGNGSTEGVYGNSESPTGFGVRGYNASGTGVYGSGAIAGQFDSPENGKIISGRGNGVEKFSVDGTGKVRASAFEGDGSGLTNMNVLMPKARFSGGSFNKDIGSTCTNFHVITMTVTSNGIISVDADAQVWLKHAFPQADEAYFYLGTSATDCSATTVFKPTLFQVPDIAAGAATYKGSMHVMRSFNVSMAGTYNLYLNGLMTAGADSDVGDGDLVKGAAMRAVFYPGDFDANLEEGCPLCGG